MSAIRLMAKAYEEEISRYYAPGITPVKVNADLWFQWEPPALFIIRECGAIAGFAVIVLNPQSLDKRIDGHYFGEFYIVPRFRRSMLPMLAASKIVKTYPGKWTADVLESNTQSLLFICGMMRHISKGFNLDIIDTPSGNFWRAQFVVRL